jgi:hypothetical protein
MRITLLALGLLAITFLVMPQAVAKFTGQHQFVNGSSVNCGKCHPDIVSEYNSDPNQPHKVLGYDCIDCHIGPVDPVWGFRIKWSERYLLLGDENYKDIQFHGAALVECLWCHTVTSSLNFGVNISGEFENSTLEAHRPFYWRAKNASGVDTADYLRGANEACISCHTHAANVTIIEPTQYLNITANFSDCIDGTSNCYSGWNIAFGVNKG